MKTIILMSCIFMISLNTFTYSAEIRKFNKYDDNYNFVIQGSYCYNSGDSIIYYGYLKSIDPKLLTPYFNLFLYYDNEFTKISIEDIVHDTIGTTNFMMSFLKDMDNNFWFGFDGGGLYKLSESGITAYDSLIKANSITQINSLLFDDKGDLWIHSNVNLYKWDGKTMEQNYAGGKDWYFNPTFIGSGYGLHQIGNKIFFQNMKQTLSYFDMVEKKVDTVSFYPYFKSDEYVLGPRVFVDNCFYLTYYLNNIVHFGKYDGKTFTNLDSYLDLINDGNPLDKLINFAIDKDKNFYFKILAGNGFSKNDSIYVVDKDMNKTSIYYRNIGLSGEITLNHAIKLSNGEVYLSSGFEGFLIITNPTSVETPTNWLFMNRLYPNPAHDRFSIDFGVEPSNLENMKVSIYDYLGRTPGDLNPEINYDSSTGKGTIACVAGSFPKGMYIVVISNGSYNKTMTLFLN